MASRRPNIGTQSTSYQQESRPVVSGRDARSCSHEKGPGRDVLEQNAPVAEDTLAQTIRGQGVRLPLMAQIFGR